MEYIDFELRISGSAATGYPVEVTRAPAGEDAKGTLTLPYDEQALNYTLLGLKLAVQSSGSTRRSGGVDEDAVSPKDFGHALYNALTQSADIKGAIARSKDVARERGQGLRIRLRIESPELAALPWEFLKDPNEREFMALSQWSPVVRYIRTDDATRTSAVTGAVRVLAMISSPSDEPTLDVEAEKARIMSATADLRQRGLLDIQWMTGSTWGDLQDKLMSEDPHIFHYIGHGGFDRKRGEGVLVFTDERGRSAQMGAAEVARLLADERSLRLVVLNSCLGALGDRTNLFSSTAATLVDRGIPAVIAMQYEISDDAAKRFSEVLYKAIATGLPVDAAMSEARKAVSVHKRDSIEWATPVLHMRAPTGRLFDVSASAIAHQQTTPSVEVPAVSLPVALGSSSAPPSTQAANFAAVASTPGAPAPEAPKPKPALDTKEFEKRVREEVAVRTATPAKPVAPAKANDGPTRLNIEANVNTSALGSWAKRIAIGVGVVATLIVGAALMSDSDPAAADQGAAPATDAAAPPSTTAASTEAFEWINDGFEGTWAMSAFDKDGCALEHRSPGYHLTARIEDGCSVPLGTELPERVRLSVVLEQEERDMVGGIRLGIDSDTVGFIAVSMDSRNRALRVDELDNKGQWSTVGPRGQTITEAIAMNKNALVIDVLNDTIAIAINGKPVFRQVAKSRISGLAEVFVMGATGQMTRRDIFFSNIKAVSLP